jgi:hypothetical protein
VRGVKEQTDTGQIAAIKTNGIDGQRHAEHGQSHPGIIFRYFGGYSALRLLILPEKRRGCQETKESVAKDVQTFGASHHIMIHNIAS